MAKNLLLAVAASCVFFLLVEGALTLVGVEPALEHSDPFVGFAARIPLYVPVRRGSGELEWVTAPNKRTVFNVQRFPRHKAPGSYRIFCLGGSTTYGRPYDEKTSFCGWLRALLPAADPSRRWEVINAGGISYASYRIAALAEDLVRHEPDLFIVYTGHNEFLERRTYAKQREEHPAVTEARRLLNRTRTYTALTRAIGLLRGGAAAPTRDREILPAEVTAILDQAAGLSWYTRENLDPPAALRDFRQNLRRIVRIGRDAGAEVLLITPASNLRDCTPFKSQHRPGLSRAERARWRAQVDAAHRALAAGRPAEALASLEEAAGLDDWHAHLHFERGRVLYALGEYPRAKRAFERARDEDICPLRASTGITELVRSVAAEEHTPLVAFDELAAERAEHAIPGEDLFLDHVHPSVETHGLLARALVDAMIAEGIVHPGAAWPEQATRAARDAIEASIDPKAQGLAQKNLAKVLNWAGKTEEAHRAALRAVELVGGWHWEAHSVAANTAVELGRIDEGIEHMRRSVRLAPDRAVEQYRLGRLLAHDGQLKAAIPPLERAVELDPNLAMAHADLGFVLGQRGRLDEALAQVETAQRLEPENPVVQARLAAVQAARGRFDEAARHAERGLRLAEAQGRADVAKDLRARLRAYRAGRR